jgi:argininosuccinate lyase
LYLRDASKEIQELLKKLQRSIVELAGKNTAVIIPGYTHLQRAQPVPIAHHLLAYVEMLQRDIDRLDDALKRINVLPLGSGALAGSTIVLNRELIAKLLDFPAISQNSMDAVSDRDFVCEFLAAVALIGMHLSRFGEDIVLWTSTEFGFVRISDAYATGSSLMPQKKNPDIAELVRGKAASLYGNLVAALTLMKGLPMTYNRDMQEDKKAVFDSIDTVTASLEVFAAMINEIEIDADAAARAVADPNLFATDVAEYLVKRGVPFRKAHEIVGRAVALCGDRHCTLRDLTLDDLKMLDPAFDDQAAALFDAAESLAARTATGSPATANLQTQIERWKGQLP